MSEINAEHIFSAQASLGEGPIWDPRCDAFWWIDILGKKLFRFRLEDGSNEEWQLDQLVGTVVVRSRGGLMLAVEHGFAEFGIDSGKLTMIHDPEADKPANRFNDGKCDPAGRFWAGTMRIDDHMEIFTGSLFSLGVNGQVTKHLGDDIGVSNGIAWTSDAKHMYFVDSPRRHIYRFDYNQDSGVITNQTVAVETPKELGFPDGMAIDVNDKLWVAFWGGRCVAQICPFESKVITKINVPVAAVTACAFGGEDLDQLLITTASVGLNDAERNEQPLAGDLFVAQPGVQGQKPFEYAG